MMYFLTSSDIKYIRISVNYIPHIIQLSIVSLAVATRSLLLILRRASTGLKSTEGVGGFIRTKTGLYKKDNSFFSILA